MKLGDTVASIATPIARALQLPCIDPQTNELRPDSPCANRKAALNNFSDAITAKLKRKEKVEFIVNRQILVEAASPEEALEKTKPVEGTSMAFNVNPKPIPQVSRQPVAPR